MNRDRAPYETLLMALFVTLTALAGWLALLLLLRLLLRGLGAPLDFWAMTEALSTALAAAAVFGAGIVAFRELREQAESRHMAVADKLFTELNAPENIVARRWVILELPADPAATLPGLARADKDKIKQVLNSLDRVAFLTQHNWIPDDMIMAWMSPMILKTWDKLEAYVAYESQRRQEPDYYRQVRALARRCDAWRQRTGLDATYKIVDHAL
ncbi:MAG: DUF4760 domain-containing protein [Caldilineales bacterium]|nr:DUF4760 domain-containing protein [Caldilineales bacterium]